MIESNTRSEWIARRAINFYWESLAGGWVPHNIEESETLQRQGKRNGGENAPFQKNSGR